MVISVDIVLRAIQSDRLLYPNVFSLKFVRDNYEEGLWNTE